MSEARVILPGSHRKPAPGAEILGPANPADQISVTVYVRGKDDPLPILSPGHYITSEEYTAAYGASANDFLAVIDFAKEYNLRSGKENPETRSIELHGAIADMSRAFGVTLNQAKITIRFSGIARVRFPFPKNFFPSFALSLASTTVRRASRTSRDSNRKLSRRRWPCSPSLRSTSASFTTSPRVSTAQAPPSPSWSSAVVSCRATSPPSSAALASRYLPSRRRRSMEARTMFPLEARNLHPKNPKSPSIFRSRAHLRLAQ